MKGKLLVDKAENMVNGNFTAIDTETTGLDPRYSELIEIGAVRFRNNKPDGEFSTLIRPRGIIPEFITSLTGISEKMTAGKPYIEEIIPQFLEFIGNDPVVGHNLSFDLSFFKEAGIDFKANGNMLIDTLRLSRRYVKGPDRIWSEEKKRWIKDMNSEYIVPDHKLSTMCDYFKIQLETSHRATADAMVTGELYCRLSELELSEQRRPAKKTL